MDVFVHPNLPKIIEVDILNKRILVDGVEFPYLIEEDGIEAISVGGSLGLAAVRLTVLAQRVTFSAGEIVESTEVIRPTEDVG